MTTRSSSTQVVQVAFSALDAAATTAWYQEVFGFLPGGEMRGATGAEVAGFMGLPTCHCDLLWLNDTSDLFQLEFFRFHDPVSSPGSRRPDDAGWTLVGLDVDDLDAVLARLRHTGAPVGSVLGDRPARRVCTCDPEGVWLELRERVPGVHPARAVRDAPVTTGFVRAVVTDLDQAREFFCGALGLRDAGTTLHAAADEALWGSSAADTRSCVLSVDGSRDSFAVELVQYAGRVPHPLPAGYRICDQGLLNIALGSRSVEDFRALTGRVRLGGFRLHSELEVGAARGFYAVGADDLSVELLVIPDSELERQLGYVPLAPTGTADWEERVNDRKDSRAGVRSPDGATDA